MANKLVFLDVDGVLNSERYLTRSTFRAGTDEYHRLMDPTACALVQHLCSETGARIVVSSAWRCNHALPDLRRMFRYRGLVAEVIDKTPDLMGVDRGLEIQRWLDANPRLYPSSMVILDDTDDMAHLTPWLVLTDSREGITHSDMRRAARKLAEPAPSRRMVG